MRPNSSNSPSAFEGSHASAPTQTAVQLRVTDLEASRKFYFDLLGFLPAQGQGYSDRCIILVSPLLAHGFRSIVLTRERFAATSQGLILELESIAELLDRYMLARLLGASTTPLMTHGRSISVSIADPDGNELELRGAVSSASDRLPTSRATADVRRWARGGEDEFPERSRDATHNSFEAAADRSLAWFDIYGQTPGAKAP